MCLQQLAGQPRVAQALRQTLGDSVSQTLLLNVAHVWLEYWAACRMLAAVELA
jgi:hypothetical protein